MGDTEWFESVADVKIVGATTADPQRLWAKIPDGASVTVILEPTRNAWVPLTARLEARGALHHSSGTAKELPVRLPEQTLEDHRRRTMAKTDQAAGPQFRTTKRPNDVRAAGNVRCHFVSMMAAALLVGLLGLMGGSPSASAATPSSFTCTGTPASPGPLPARDLRSGHRNGRLCRQRRPGGSHR